MTIRFLNPMKLGDAGESWLSVEGRDCEWTAATWRYFFCSARLSATTSAVASEAAVGSVLLPFSATLRVVLELAVELSTLVTVAVFMT